MTKSASYLDRPTFSLTSNDLSAWGPAVFALMLLGAIGLVYLCLGAAGLAMSLEHKRLYGADGSTAAKAAADNEKISAPADDNSDFEGADYITFTQGSQNYYWRQNDKTGQILILSGMVRNSYPEARRFIRLRARILGRDGATLADSFVYAGNLIGEDELKTLPYKEILKRLSNKGGQDGRNMYIAPGAEIPFMVVFDKLPDDMSEYLIDPVDSSPAR